MFETMNTSNTLKKLEVHVKGWMLVMKQEVEILHLIYVSIKEGHDVILTEVGH